MGYYTNYEMIDVDADCEKLDVLKSLLKEKDIIGYAFDESLNSYDAVKWYSNETDMKEITSDERLKDVRITIKGEGEEPGDVWIKYFMNGKCQVCKAVMTFDPFDENKLK